MDQSLSTHQGLEKTVGRKMIHPACLNRDSQDTRDMQDILSIEFTHSGESENMEQPAEIQIETTTVETMILVIRCQRVLLDADLARLYGVSTKAFNQAIKRNRRRFPSDFMFQLTQEEKSEVVTICDRLHPLRFSTTLPNAFTEHGAIMAASVLNTDSAIEMSVYVVRAFVKLRELLIANRTLGKKVDELERRLNMHDDQIRSIVTAIKQLIEPPAPKRRAIGFHVEDQHK